MKALHWVLLAGGVAVVTGVVVLKTGSDDASEGAVAPLPAVASKEPAATQPPAQPSSRSGCRFEDGQRIDVALSVKSSVELTNAPAPIPRGTILAEALTASVRLEVLEVDAAHAVMLGEFADVQATGQTPGSAYAKPFLLEVERDCEVTRFARHKETPSADARLEQAALWELSWRWSTADEVLTRRNGRGSYVARATTARVGGEVLAQRRIESYGQLWLGGAASGVTGFSSVTVGPQGWFDSLQAEETLSTNGGTTKTRVVASARQTRGRLSHLDRNLAHYVWDDLLARQLSRREEMPVTAGDKALRLAMQDKTPEQAVQLAQEKFAREQNLAASWPPLRAYLEVHPEKTEQVAAELRSGKVSEDGLNPYFIAMGNARTPQAKDTLLRFMRDDHAPPAIRARAMFSLVDRADVGVELAREFARTSQALEGNPVGAVRFVASEALLAVSTMAGLHEEAEVRDVALRAIRASLSLVADRRTQGTALRALANLGDATLLGEAEPYTHAAEERVRRAAAKVVRRMNPRDTEAFVLRWLAHEPSLFVKKELFVTVEAQHFDAQANASEALGRALLRELQDENHAVIARKALVRLVGGSSIAREPAVREALKAQARRALKRRDGLASDVFELLTPEEIREVAP